MKFNKKIIYTILSAIVIVLTFTLADVNKVSAVTVGDQLNSPEAGWSRHEDYNSNITYTNGNWVISTASIFSNSHCTWTTSHSAVCKFNFNGSKIRILSDNISHDTTNVNVKIDGQDAGSFSEYRSYEIGRIVCYERTDLSPGEHSIEMTTMDTRSYTEFVIDAIDLEEYGQIIPFHEIHKNAILKIIPDKYTNEIGKQFTANISFGKIENINYEDIVISYDQSKLKYNGITRVDGTSILKAKNKNGIITICCKNLDTNTLLTRTLLGIKFTPIAAGNALIKVDKCKVANNSTQSLTTLRSDECNEEIISIS